MAFLTDRGNHGPINLDLVLLIDVRVVAIVLALIRSEIYDRARPLTQL